MEEIAFIPTVANDLLKEFVFLLLTLAFSPRAGGSCGRATSARSARSAPWSLMFVGAFIPRAITCLHPVYAETLRDLLGRRSRRNRNACLHGSSATSVASDD